MTIEEEKNDRRGWPEHEEPVQNNKPAMTQSDAPNEGIEEKHECEFFLVTDVAVYACECERIEVSGKTYYPEEDINALRYRLTDLRDQLSKERKMRKELVVGLRKITSTIPNVNNSIELMMWNIANDLISKASELDKNLKAHNEGKSYNEFDQEQRGWKPK